MEADAMIGSVTDKAKIQSAQAKMREANLRTQRKSSPEEIEKTAVEFEAVFLSQMMEHMFADVDIMPMSDGPGEDIYKSMLLDEYGKVIARAGGIGVADHVKREMISIQEAQQHGQ